MEEEIQEEVTASPEPPVLPSVEEAAAWLNATKPNAVLALLKEPLYGFNVSRAFLGFRADAKGYSNPLVRSRLAQAAAKDAKLAAKLRELAEAEPKTVKAEPKAATSPAPEALPQAAKPDPLLTLRAERDARRRERDEARLTSAQAQAERDAAQKALQSSEAERDDAMRQAKKQAERIARLERQVAQLRQSEARLSKALREDKVSPPPSKPARQSGTSLPELPPRDLPWPTAVRHLLDKSKFDLALSLAEDVLKSDRDNLEALEIAARAWEGKHDLRAALASTRRLLTVQIGRADLPAAAETLQRIFRLTASIDSAEPEVRAFLAALAPADSPAIDAARRMLAKLRGFNAPAHDWLTTYIDSRTDFGPILMPPPGALGPDEPLPLTLPAQQAVTARQLVEAIDRGSTDLVGTVRTALASLAETDPETSERVWTALESAASDDLARLQVLRRTPRGPIVVDGSNVAWFDQESLVQGRPRLKHITAMRRALWLWGFFPVVLYADANLPYAIDETASLRAMRDRRELTLVDAGTVADEVLVRNAKNLGAPLVTNDRMEDWDPNGDVPKVRYTISLGGEAHLLTDITRL